MKLLIGIFVSLVLNTALVLIGHGRFVFDILVLAACFWIAAPLFLFSGIFLAIAYRKPHPVMIEIGKWLMLSSLVIGSTLIAIPFGGKLNQSDINKAKIYCEQTAVILDIKYDLLGAYPTNLTGIITERDMPRILRGGNLYYHSQGTNYSITFSDPGGMMSGWYFIGNTKQWSQFD